MNNQRKSLSQMKAEFGEQSIAEEVAGLGLRFDPPPESEIITVEFSSHRVEDTDANRALAKKMLDRMAENGAEIDWSAIDTVPGKFKPSN